MRTKSNREYLETILNRYHIADKKEKRTILDEFCIVCEYNSKFAIGLFSRGYTTFQYTEKRSARRPKKYDDPVILEPLRRIWTMLNLTCSGRPKAALPLWLPYMMLVIVPR